METIQTCKIQQASECYTQQQESSNISIKLVEPLIQGRHHLLEDPAEVLGLARHELLGGGHMTDVINHSLA